MINNIIEHDKSLIDYFGKNWKVDPYISSYNNVGISKTEYHKFTLSGRFSGSYNYLMLSGDAWGKTSNIANIGDSYFTIPLVPGKRYKFCVYTENKMSADRYFALTDKTTWYASTHMSELTNGVKNVKYFTAKGDKCALFLRGETSDYSGTYVITVEECSEEENRDAILKQIAPIEDGSTASQPYLQGEYFFQFGVFCKALTAIAIEETFTKNTNYKETTVAAELLAAQN